MKLITTILAGTLVLAGCTTKNYYVEDTPTTTRPPVTTTRPRPTTTMATFGVTSESEFLRAVREESRAARIMYDQDLLNAGWATCQAFDRGLSALDVVTAMSSTMGDDPDFDAMLIATASLATVWLCPEYIDIWNGYE